MKLKYTIILSFYYVVVSDVFSQSANINYIRSRTYTNETGTHYLDEIQYLNGFGNSAQLIQVRNISRQK